MKTGTANHRRVKAVMRVLLFTVLFALSFLYLSAVMQPAETEIIGMKGFYAEEKNTLDAVYIGGSVCFECWAPYEAWHEYGLTSYAFGKSTLYSFSVLPLVQEVLAHQSPEVLVIDLRPFQYTDPANGVLKECSLACASGMPLLSPNRFEILRRGYEYSNNKRKEDTLLTFYFDISRYHGSWKLLSEDSFRYALPGTQKHANKGFYFIASAAPIQLTRLASVTDRLPVSALSERNLLELLDYLQKVNQKAVFAVTTYSELEPERKQYNYLSDILRRHGFDYLNANDYNDEMGMDPLNDYYNTAHTNINGAEKYTRFIAGYLKEHYTLPDKRDDAAYQSWRDGYGVWEKNVKDIKAAIQQSKVPASTTAVPN